MGLTPLGDGDLSMAVECYMRSGMNEPDARRTAERDVRDLREGWAQYRRLRDGTIDPDTLPTREPGEEG